MNITTPDISECILEHAFWAARPEQLMYHILHFLLESVHHLLISQASKLWGWNFCKHNQFKTPHSITECEIYNYISIKSINFQK